ncbi:MAG: hypothetical protein K5888_05620 [Lachnospiraceae bacterium]|nr:hypothetical protein [Lachnospiraceae bacterium]
MSSLDIGVVNREVAFCRVYSKEAKEKLEKLFLKNQISYFVECQEKSLLSKLMGKGDRNVFTIKINDADLGKATALVQGIDSVKVRKPRP